MHWYPAWQPRWKPLFQYVQLSWMHDNVVLSQNLRRAWDAGTPVGWGGGAG